MRAFKLLPSSPDIKGMNDAQWLFCYFNILKDSEEEEDMWKARAKYHGMFINPEAVRKLDEIERGQYNNSSNNNISNSNVSTDKYVNDEFEKELQSAFANERFIELPQDTDTRGNANMSSEEFLSMCLETYKETENEIEEDLDIIEIE